ncbi:MAG TPA: hypothetical protein VIY49_32675 [Bryobacteraceae bacterium]
MPAPLQSTNRASVSTYGKQLAFELKKSDPIRIAGTVNVIAHYRLAFGRSMTAGRSASSANRASLRMRIFGRALAGDDIAQRGCLRKARKITDPY